MKGCFMKEWLCLIVELFTHYQERTMTLYRNKGVPVSCPCSAFTIHCSLFQEVEVN